MNYCANCGRKLPDGAKYCGYCGHGVTRTSADSRHPMPRKLTEDPIETDATNKEVKLNLFSLYFETFRKSFEFSGRSSRREYWNFQLWYLITVFVLAIVEEILEISPEDETGLLVGLFYIIAIVPTFSVCIRRMHDVNKSGWFSIVPIYNLILTLRQGDEEENSYGVKPVN